MSLFGRRMKQALAALLGCAVAAALFVGVEAVFLVLNRHGATQARVEMTPSTGLYEFRLIVGYRPRPNAEVRAVKGGGKVYDITYRTDALHRRVVPEAGQLERERFIALFGGSFAFGEGVQDNETLAYYLAHNAPSYGVYNFACPGYGPQQTLVQLTSPEYEGQIPQAIGLGPQATGLGIYVMIPHHVRRAIGSMRTVTQWGRHFPNFVLDSNGKLVHEDTFKLGRPMRTQAYLWLEHEQISRFFGVDWPVRVSPSDLTLTARILSEAKQAFQSRYPESPFYVLLYPHHPRDEFRGTRMKQPLSDAGVDILDYTAALDLTEPGMLIEGDLHPTGKAHEQLAGLIVKDLGLAQ